MAEVTAVGSFCVSAEPSVTPTFADAYIRKALIGRGAFADVWQASVVDTGLEVAVKILSLDNSKFSAALEEIGGEVRTMKACNHPNVLACYCCFVHGRELWLVMPWLEQGSCLHLLKLLKKAGKIREGQGFSEEWIATILHQVLQGLEYLHKLNLVHR